MRTLTWLTIVAASLAGCQSDTTAPVLPGPLTLKVQPGTATINGTKVIRLVARVYLEDGTSYEPSGVRWISANQNVAIVGSDGLVQGLRPGRVQIVAAWRDSKGWSTVSVADQVPKPPTEHATD